MQISFERSLIASVPGYNVNTKLTSDTIFHYLNKAKDDYIKQLYRVFQQNQEISDKLRILVRSTTYQKVDFEKQGNKWIGEYPTDYMFSLGEEVEIEIVNNKCPNIKVKTRDVIEATIENVDRILENSLSEYHLHHNQARPVRLQSINSIILYTDGNYDINKYTLNYLRNGIDMGDNLTKQYEDLPKVCHQEVVDLAVRLYMSEAASAAKASSSDE